MYNLIKILRLKLGPRSRRNFYLNILITPNVSIFSKAIAVDEAIAVAIVNIILDDDDDDVVEEEEEELLHLLALLLFFFGDKVRNIPKTLNYFEQVIPLFSLSGKNIYIINKIKLLSIHCFKLENACIFFHFK